jgi:hypothetical protein
MADLRMVFIALAVAGALITAGCSDDGKGGIEADNPRVVAIYPQAGAADVNLNPLVQVWFDQELDEATVDSASCHVVGAVTERLEYDASQKAICLYLKELLAPETGYEIFVDSTITNKAGAPLTEDQSSTFTTGPMDCDHLEDYLEPNDTIDAAAEIDIVKVYPLLSSCGDGSDEYYSFTVNDTVLVTARIEHVYSDDPKPGWYIHYKRATDEAYTSSIGWFAEGMSINSRFTFLPGTYYLHTGSGEPQDRIVVYNLILQLSAPCLDDSLEDNDFIDQASPIGPGLTEGLRGCYRDRDCYSIRLGVGHTLTITVDQDPDIGSQLDLEILGPDGAVLTGGMYTENPAIIAWTAAQDTTHYIGATYWSNNVSYSIEVDVMSLP